LENRRRGAKFPFALEPTNSVGGPGRICLKSPRLHIMYQFTDDRVVRQLEKVLMLAVTLCSQTCVHITFTPMHCKQVIIYIYSAKILNKETH
jgi:hypothetical protein